MPYRLARWIGDQDFFPRVFQHGVDVMLLRIVLIASAMHPDWARGLRDACVERGVPFFFKGWGRQESRSRHLDGREWNELPT